MKIANKSMKWFDGCWSSNNAEEIYPIWGILYAYSVHINHNVLTEFEIVKTDSNQINVPWIIKKV